MTEQATTFVGEAGVSTYRAIVIKAAIRMKRDHNMMPNRGWTVRSMLNAASSITGNPYRRGQYTQAIADLETWIKEHGTTGENT